MNIAAEFVGLIDQSKSLTWACVLQAVGWVLFDVAFILLGITPFPIFWFFALLMSLTAYGVYRIRVKAEEIKDELYGS